MRPRIVAVVPARLGSTRLPGKVLLDLADRTILDWVVGRARRARAIDQLVVATTSEPSDDDLVQYCRDAGYPVIRGSRDDVLDRVVTAAASERADIVIRLASHGPLIDPEIVDSLVDIHQREHRDYTTNSLPAPHPRTYPIGLDVEVVSMSALTEAWANRSDQRHRENVTPYLYEEPGRFNVRLVAGEDSAGDARWAVETRADLEALRALVTAANARTATSWRDLLRAWRDHPGPGFDALGQVS